MGVNTYHNPNRNFGRSLAFSEFLNRQTPEQKRKILAAERSYLSSANDVTGRNAAYATAFTNSLKGPPSKFPVSQLLDPAAST
jgi:hypothetical protein